ncbi:hypothetical protein IAD21_04073 [Abditibacteriota bacterium]|nr:hypothetical protein IAD21_04073 [Abditibacteriota bacterium]
MNIGGFLRHHAAGIIFLAILLGGIGLVLYPAFQHETSNARRSICQSNLHDIMRACLEYQTDYGGRYPPLSDGGTKGWSVILQRSAPNVHLGFSCPEGYESSFAPTSDYFYNARCAGRKEDSVVDPASTIAFGDGLDNGPTNSHYWQLPNDGANPHSVLRRHYWGSNYAFADGHVKMLIPEQVSEWGQDEKGNGSTRFKFSPDGHASHRERR